MVREERFWNKVQRSGNDTCWLWIAGQFNNGYGKFRDGRKFRGAHRVSWELANGAVPAGLFVCHNCPTGDNKLCVNPAHLWLGTNTDNQIDAVKKNPPRVLSQAYWDHLRRRENHQNAKLTTAIAIKIRERFSGGENMCQLARDYGVSSALIWQVIRRGAWS